MKRSFEIRNALGLHARAAAQLVQLAAGFSADLTIEKDGKSVNGKSIMGVMMLSATQGSLIEVEAMGTDAEELLTAIATLIQARFHEDH
ncbi:MAG: HPr family phosphocarrier protein [Deltaproteobacteria bacterium]